MSRLTPFNIIIAITVFLMPWFAYAQFTMVELILARTALVLSAIMALLFLLATIVFIWGLIVYVIGSSGDKTKLEQGKRLMFWGVIGLFFMAAAWAIVKLLCNYFFFTIVAPCVF